MRVLYFAWLREQTGTGAEDVTSDAATVAELASELRARSPGHAAALADLEGLHAAVDQKLVSLDAPIAGAAEVAFFPPMTGG